MVSRSSGPSMAQSCAKAQAWVKDNYEKHLDGVVAKSVIYKHYEDQCRQEGRPVMETSIFGRVVKQVFPDVNIRRLGGRENLKYYYCGIQAQSNSPYVSDNTNTTRPKRKQRKREFMADKTEVQNCVRWLNSHYCSDHDGSVAIYDVYSHYSQCCITWTSEPLTQQQLSIVVMNAFQRISKRKTGPKSPQQNVFVGISLRAVPVDPNSIPINTEFISMFDSLSTGSKHSSYRDESNTPDDEDDYSCRSPDSEEGSDLSAGTENSCGELKSESYPYYSSHDSMIKDEPVDYSIATLRLKEEPVDTSMSVVIKEEKISDPIMSCYRSGTPERPPSHMMDSPSPSPSPPQKSIKNRIYKPRFHIDYHDNVWSEDPSIKIEPENLSIGNNLHRSLDDIARGWLVECLQKSEGNCVNRDQVYRFYERFCTITNINPLPLAAFDKIVVDNYPGTVTMVHSTGSTLYEGVSVIPNSDIAHGVEQFLPSELHSEVAHGWEANAQVSLAMSSSPRHSSSPIILDEDDEDIDDDFSVDKYRETMDDDLHSIPEVLRDGKYYLKNWLTENFEPLPEACVLKADAYRHYEQYAKSVLQTPFEMNVFGKIVRQVFPNVSIRRLGGRMKPQYHYCGITAKQTSPIYSLLSGKDPAQRSRKKEIATDNRTAEVVIEWLKKSYEPCKERIIMKHEVFINYNTYCNSLGENPVSLNYFGKLVKHCFPNVEVRKFGGRTDPNWFYFGLNPIDPCMLQHSMSIDEFSESSISQYDGAVGHSPQHHSQNTHHHHHAHHQSIPIAVPGGGPLAALDSPYSGSPQILVPSLNAQYLQSQLLRQECQRQQQQSPFSGSPSLEPKTALTPEPYPRSPGLSRAFRDGLITRNTHDASRMMVRSPYEPDVAPEGIFPRSPEDSSAQTCRSPTSSSHTEATTLHLSSSGIYYSQGGLLSSSPNSKRGAQVVPSQTPPSYHHSFGHHPHHQQQMGGGSDVSAMFIAHKRAKHQVAPEDYTIFSGRS